MMMHEEVVLKAPSACTDVERVAFARAIREGFPTAGSDLDERVNRAACLAWWSGPDGSPGAIAALKAPPDTYRHTIFTTAGAPLSPDRYRDELGWIYVVPAQRRRGIATALCERLLAEAGDPPTFATTRVTNVGMIRIFDALAFTRVGQPFAWRGEHLLLYARQAAA